MLQRSRSGRGLGTRQKQRIRRSFAISWSYSGSRWEGRKPCQLPSPIGVARIFPTTAIPEPPPRGTFKKRFRLARGRAWTRTNYESLRPPIKSLSKPDPHLGRVPTRYTANLAVTTLEYLLYKTIAGRRESLHPPDDFETLNLPARFFLGFLRLLQYHPPMVSRSG